MTSEAAIYQFMNSFGIPAYASSSVPDDASFPYMTYDIVIGEMFESEVNVPVNVWYRTESEAQPNAKVREMFNRIGFGGTTIAVDGGMIWIKRGSPWAQALVVEGEDEMVKRRYVNINIEFFIV